VGLRGGGDWECMREGWGECASEAYFRGGRVQKETCGEPPEDMGRAPKWISFIYQGGDDNISCSGSWDDERSMESAGSTPRRRQQHNSTDLQLKNANASGHNEGHAHCIIFQQRKLLRHAFSTPRRPALATAGSRSWPVWSKLTMTRTPSGPQKR
jgi:hypothetical protein